MWGVFLLGDEVAQRTGRCHRLKKKHALARDVADHAERKDAHYWQQGA